MLEALRSAWRELRGAVPPLPAPGGEAGLAVAQLARRGSAINATVLFVSAAVAIVLFWPTDLLVVGEAREALPGFVGYRAVMLGVLLAFAAAVRWVPLVNRHAPAALVVTTSIGIWVALHGLGPAHLSLERGWLDTATILPFATCGLLVGLAHRVLLTGVVIAVWAVCFHALAPLGLAEPQAWVHLVTLGFAGVCSVAIGHTAYLLMAGTAVSLHTLSAVRTGLEARVTARTLELQGLYDHIVERREDERAHLARELHDATGQLLTGLRLELDLLALDTPPVGPRRALLDDLTGRLDGVFEAVELLLRELHPKVLDDLGLPAALQWLAAETERRAGVRIVCHVDEAAAKLDRRRATALFRLAQDALGEVVRHAEASRLELRLEQTGALLRLVVEDDGTASLGAPRGGEERLVRADLRERARSIGATLRLRDDPGTTTEIRLSLEALEREAAP